YSTITRARAQLIGCRSWRMRKRELGTIEPSMRGWRKKLRAKRRAFPFLVVGRAVWALFSTTTPARARSDRHSITIIARGHHSAGAAPPPPPLRASSAAGALRRLAPAAGNLTADHHARRARPRARRALLRGTRRLPGARRSLQHHATKGLPRPHRALA